MIIIGYQGIGKSTLANIDCFNEYIDLESGNFWIDEGIRHQDWYIVYCNIAESLSEQGYTVFVSSHKDVRNELAKRNTYTVCCAPMPYLKEQWVKKLEDRYAQTHLSKDYKAWKNAEECFDDNIMDISNGGFDMIWITSMDYDLRELIEHFEHSNSAK